MALGTESHSILIIDDNVANLKVVMAHLNAYSFEILTARDGNAGLERAQIAQPDLILLDLQMPGLDGFEVCRRLKAHPQTQNIPVIFMTANSETDAVVRGFELGAVDYVIKPFASAELIARVQTHLTLRDLQQNLEEMVAVKTAVLAQEIEQRKKAQLEVEHLLEIVRQQSDQYGRLSNLHDRLKPSLPNIIFENIRPQQICTLVIRQLKQLAQLQTTQFLDDHQTTNYLEASWSTH